MSERVDDDDVADAGPAPPAPRGLHVEWLEPDLALLSYPLPEADIPPALSAAEQEIALLVYEGACNEEIATQRGASVKTVSNQLDAIYRKLGVRSRVELVLQLRGRGPANR
jgi:DNA-binding NarL/FixJ family response regulator